MGVKEEEAKQQEQNIELRAALGNAYGAVEGAKLTQSFSAITIEELTDQQIERIEGPDTTARPNALHRIERILQGMLESVAKIKSLPDDAFNKQDPSKDVNTKP